MEETMEFRFATKEEYDRELASVVGFLNVARSQKTKKSRREEAKLEEAYDELLDEYLRFCGERDSG